MAIYKYVAKDAAGQTYKQSLEAKNKEDFLEQLKQNNLYCISYKEYHDKKATSKYKLNLKQLVIFCRQFATMLDSGVSLIKCIDILYQQSEDKKMKQLFLGIYENVQKGNALSTSLKAQGNAFPELFISMVESGEASGTLDTVLVRMANHYESENKLNNKVKNAMVYPCILGVVSIGVMIIMLAFVVPTFAEMFEGMGELPKSTQFLMKLSTFINEQWVVVLIGTIVVGMIGFILSQTEAFRAVWDRTKLTIPVIGKLNLIILSARFAQTTSSMYANGMSLVDVLDITQRVLGNRYINPRFEVAKNEISKGIPLSQAILKMDIFPPMLVNMILVGEESGRLEGILEKTAAFYQEEADTAIQKMVALLEPAMIIILGIIIGGIIASILPPMYEMMGNIQ